MDSVGIGELPDAAAYGDQGSNTLGNIARSITLQIPTLRSLGLPRLVRLRNVEPIAQPLAAYGRMAEASAGKDTTTGHWEMTGIHLDKPFPVYPHGFPPEVMEPFKKAIGTDILGNHMASGIEVIDNYGQQHLDTGFPIVYTSVDSVFQIAAHKDVIPVPRLYEICLEARRILTGKHSVGRVIARPFDGRPGSFRRTYERKDFSLVQNHSPPPFSKASG